MRMGAVFCLNAIAENVGLAKALGRQRQGRLALWQVLARSIDQGPRLSAVRLAESHAACDILGLDAFNEEHLYANLSWLFPRAAYFGQLLLPRSNLNPSKFRALLPCLLNGSVDAANIQVPDESRREKNEWCSQYQRDNQSLHCSYLLSNCPWAQKAQVNC